MGKDATSEQKWMYSIYAAVIFFVISNPVMYMYVDAIIRKIGEMLGQPLSIASKAGKPTQMGVVVHAVVYMLAVRLLMEKPEPTDEA